MRDELKGFLELKIAQIKARFQAQIRKQQIRHAYHPVRIAMPLVGFILMLLLFAVIILAIAKFTTFFSDDVNTVVRVDTVTITDTITSADEIDQSGDYFLAPFPAIAGQDELEYLIVADKYDRVLHLLKRQKGIWGVIKSYPIAIGANAGRKKLRWDKKTPEGTYIIVNRKEDDELNEIYGPLAYVLNYPNREDSLAGRTGSGIWIHGTVPGKVPVDTKGCLEMHNNNLLKLAAYLKKGDLVPVVIHNNPTFNLERDLDLIKIWNEREQVIASRLPKDSVSEDPIALAQTSVVDTIKDATQNSHSITQKDTVKIDTTTQTVSFAVNSLDTTKRDTTSSESAVQLASNISQDRKADSLLVIKRIHQWEKDWESANILKYQSNYDTLSFQSGSYDWDKWRMKKIRTFKNYSTISVKISKLRIEKLSDTRAEVYFFQNYQSDLFRAENGKRIILQKRDGHWKIVQELTVRG